MAEVSSACVYTCVRCAMFYCEYEHLVAHLYWRHGTESVYCNKCGLRQWRFAAHVCSVLPTDGTIENSQVDTLYCFCGIEDNDAPMIGCDAPNCTRQWFHFKCVGIVTPPDGKWFCPDCRKICTAQMKYHNKKPI